ncbi:signal peptidase I [Rossellomorea marisflavi]|uniref:signal peptidase I n=1 Tax=Rossellomorea marisflavi TaxID=189381 RepID=UPI003F9F3FE8
MKQHMKKVMVSGIVLAILIIGGTFLLRNVYTPLKVNGMSMSPTLKNEQYVVVDRLAYDHKEADYRDIVIASNIADDHGYIVKRIVGKPGDKIEFRDNQLYRNGVAVKNIVLPADAEDTPEDVIVPKGEYYLMGDNIPESVDSRIMGTFSTTDIFGKVVYK